MQVDSDIGKTISQRNCEKIKLSDICTTVERHSRECLKSVLQTCDTIARMSRDCRASVVNITVNVIAYMS